jgi:membrane protein implicated in regulation of membrane protease activity
LLAAALLVIGLMLLWAAIADPVTGVFRSPHLAVLALLAVFALAPVAFYVDYRLQIRRTHAQKSSDLRATQIHARPTGSHLAGSPRPACSK